MRAVVQRVSQASVRIKDEIVGEIGQGILVLLGVEEGDTPQDARYLMEKSSGLRIFEDDQGKMNLSVADLGGDVLVVSQFTLLGDVRKGKRPSFIRAATPELGKELYLEFVDLFRQTGLKVETGIFQAMMDVSLVNHGPVTILLDSRKTF